MAILLGILLGLAGSAVAAELPGARSEEVGVSSAPLACIAQVLRADVETGRISGAVVLAARRGRVAYHEAVAFPDKAAGAPMTMDAIFRIASMSKPLTTVAAMSLWGEGRPFRSDRVSRHLPAFNNLKVGVERPDATGEMTVPLGRHHSPLVRGLVLPAATQ